MGDSEKLSDLPKSLGQYLVGSRRSDPQRHYATPTGPQCPGLCRCLLQEVIVPPQRISYSFSCRSCWWPASAIPRPLLTLTPYPSEALGPQQPAFSVGQHIRRYVLKRPKDLAEHVTRACRPQASSPGIQGGKVGRPQGPSPRSGPWVPRPESKAGHQSSEQLRHMLGIIPTVYGGKT